MLAQAQPSLGQLALLALGAGLFIAALVISVARRRDDPRRRRRPVMFCLAGGLAASIATIAWHAGARGQWHPMTDNFEALLWLGTLLAGFVMYLTAVKPIRGIEWFLLPVAIGMHVSAAIFGRAEFHGYSSPAQRPWIWVHQLTAYGGALVLIVAAAAGAMYVISSRRLRHKRPGPPLGNLESLERQMMGAGLIGFALLTIGMITGIARMSTGRVSHTKVILGVLAWLVYAIVVHAPINPRFRGRRAALLSILGFALVIGTIVVVQLA